MNYEEVKKLVGRVVEIQCGTTYLGVLDAVHECGNCTGIKVGGQAFQFKHLAKVKDDKGKWKKVEKFLEECEE